MSSSLFDVSRLFSERVESSAVPTYCPTNSKTTCGMVLFLYRSSALHCFLSLPELVLLIRDLFQPIHRSTIESLLHRDVRHSCGWCCTMPVLDASGNPNDISLANYLNGSAPLLNPADTVCHDQDLAERMGVPGGSRSWLKRHLATARTCRFPHVEKRLHANRTREVIRSAGNDLLGGGWRN